MKNKVRWFTVVVLALAVFIVLGMARNYPANAQNNSAMIQADDNPTSAHDSIAPQDKANRKSEMGSAEQSGGVMSGISPEQSDVHPSVSALATSCNWWWVNGHSDWQYTQFWFYVNWSAHGRTWTEYGTSTGSCGVPLTVDRIYVRVRLHPTSYYAALEGTNYNTNDVSVGKNGQSWNVPNLCGADGYHEASKSGITWHTTSTSGCTT